jgi:predicted enzyme related to lactoylglutathione lyase
LRTPALFGLLVLAVLFGGACTSGGDEDTASIIHRLLIAAGSDASSDLESFPGELPKDMPIEPPLYPGATLVTSSRQAAPTDQTQSPQATPAAQPLLYFIVLDTGDHRDDVFTFYEDALDKDPWQLESSFSTAELDTFQFLNAEDPDISGVVSIATGGEDGRTSILISLQDSGAILDEEAPFEPGESLPVPQEFPDEIPLYEGATVTSDAFLREPGNVSFLLIFLTTDPQEDVVEFYRGVFEELGWNVTEQDPIANETRINFTDDAGDIQGSVQSAPFDGDDGYTETRVQFNMNPARPAPGEESDTPQPAD